MRTGMLVLWLVPLLAACAAPVQADAPVQAQQAQQAPLVQQIVVHDYALDSITGSHLKRRRGDSPMNGQTVSRDDWERGRPDPCARGCM